MFQLRPHWTPVKMEPDDMEIQQGDVRTARDKRQLAAQDTWEPLARRAIEERERWKRMRSKQG